MASTDSTSKYFRESFRGFNKNDVVGFIAKLSKEHTESIEKCQKNLSDLKADHAAKLDELNSLTQEHESKTKKLLDLQEKYAGLEKEYLHQKEMVESLSQPDLSDKNKIKEQAELIGTLKKTVTENNSEKEFLLNVIKKFELETGLRITDICGENILENKKISFENNMIDMAEARKKISRLEEELSTLKKENAELLEIRSKTEELSSDEQTIYETITADLGNVIYSAKKTAESIVDKARGEADDIMSKANAKRTIFFEEYDKDIFKLKEKYKCIQNEYSDMLNTLKNSYDGYSEKLLDIEKTIDEIYNKFQ